MTEPTRDALHERTLEMLREEAREYGTRMKSAYPEERAALAEEYKYAAACVKRVPELEAEVERLRAKAAVVDAINAGDVEQMSGWNNEDGPTKFWVRLVKSGPMAFGFGPTLEAAYAAATREGTDA